MSELDSNAVHRNPWWRVGGEANDDLIAEGEQFAGEQPEDESSADVR
ncbi:hypothetical protein [Nonomuraea sp. MG754425]|nr:hypothetical protein [Nonomuraea sp. MG754425]